jgi:hypothetical protein
VNDAGNHRCQDNGNQKHEHNLKHANGKHSDPRAANLVQRLDGGLKVTSGITKLKPLKLNHECPTHTIPPPS